MSECLICGGRVEPFISFGQQPIANRFVDSQSEINNEHFFELEVGLCSNEFCRMVQLTNTVEREEMFHDDYAYFSQTSKGQTAHFAELAESIRRKRGDDQFVVEIGCNDGIFLRNFLETGCSVLGIEPSANVAAAAREQGIEVECSFFDMDVADRILESRGHADVIFAANTFCHIPYLGSVVKGIKRLLAPDGVFIFEDPYLGDIIEKTSYDQIYDEHAFYFSVTSVRNLCNRYGLDVVDVDHQDVHGGSMRYTISHQGKWVSNAAVKNQELAEAGLGDMATYERFRENVEASRAQLRQLLITRQEQGKRVVGYGATSKSTTVLNYCDIGPELIEFISDTTPGKQGKLTPGTHIPVRPYADFADNPPDSAVLFAWNHAKEIMEKESFAGEWITYVPKVTSSEVE